MEATQYRPFAVITSASSDVGFEMARQFAENGYDLLICGGDETIFSFQRDLETYDTDVTAVMANLSTFNGVENLYGEMRNMGRPISVVVINTSIGEVGEFRTSNLKTDVNLINQNITSVVHLTKKILPDLIEQNEGQILYVASDSAQAVCGATRAFIISFAEAMREEVKDTHVSIVFHRPSFKTKVQGWASKILPESIKARMPESFIH